jgi:hypothetical protein
LEQDGYGVIFLYRDEYYHPENTQNAGEAEIIVAKNRNGSTGTVMAKFDGPCTRFYSDGDDMRDACDDIDAGIGAEVSLGYSEHGFGQL